MRVICCVCGRVRKGDVWVDPSPASTDEQTTHTYCPSCKIRALEAIKELPGRNDVRE